MVEIKVRNTSMVKPGEKTDKPSIPLTVVDRMFPSPGYNSSVNIYRPSEGIVVDAAALRESLSKTLVHFYPMAGRYRLDENGAAVEIDCNDAGVYFVEAETESDLEALGDLAPSPQMTLLVPRIDVTQPIPSCPLMAVQITYFKCGSVSLGIRMEHCSVDGSSAFHLSKSWSEISRGVEISVSPFFDRSSMLCPRDPPEPKFDHSKEYPHHDPSKEVSPEESNTILSTFKLTREQICELKAANSEKKHSTFALVAGHIWKCVCKVRGVAAGEETRLAFPVNGRFKRLTPALPSGFFGNAVFLSRSVARAGDLVEKPVSYAASIIEETLLLMDNEYLRSTIDHLALLPDLTAVRRGPHLYSSPNFHITSWVRLGVEDADFGWGFPVYSGPSEIRFEKAYIFPADDEGLNVTMSLRREHMEKIESLLYDLF